MTMRLFPLFGLLGLAACAPSTAVVPPSGDCDECDDVDNDTETDDADTDTGTSDTGTEPVEYEDLDGDGQTGQIDCNDADATVYPGATETCNGIDDDCDGSVDESLDCDDDEWSGYVEASGFVISFSQTGFSGDLYLADAYMVGYGADGSFGYNLNNGADNDDGRFAFDTSGWEEGDYLASLISSLSVTNNGGGDYTYEEIDSWDETGDWWNTLPFCSDQDSQTAAIWCAYEGAGKYFVAFKVTSSGVIPDGDGI